MLVAYPPTLAISALMQHLKGPTANAVRREFTGACVRARMRATMIPILLRSLLRRRTTVHHQAVHRQTNRPL
ncbi:hypothetical protein [Mycolicibacterium doricum]|uniref:hypothetical protein n=1 Tax=Mycolicibacterium doricum TaxID=126673 RepID=UPI001F36BFF6|nr:hypothetical protein [Mycolicibacterium doricum]